MRDIWAARAAAGALCLAVVWTPALADTAPSRRSGPPVNAAGQPLRSATGQPLNYQQADWRTAPSANRAAPSGQAGAKGSQVELQPTWNWAAYGRNIGVAGLVSATVNGTTEIYAGAAAPRVELDTYWYALTAASRRLGAGLKQVFVSEDYGQPIVKLAVARAAQGEQRIVVALQDGTLVQYDAVTKQIKDRAAGPCATRRGQQAFEVGDLDGDGVDEFVSVCSDQALVVHGPAYARWTLSGVGGTSIAIAQMDNDPAIEVATNAGNVVDTATRSVQWTRSGGFGAKLIAGDIDGDGRAELIAADSWYWVNAYDVEKQLPKWSLQMGLDIAAIMLGDVNADGVKELLVADGQWGSIHAFDPVTLVELGAISNPEHGVTNMLLADVNGGGATELLWGAGATSTGPNFLFVSTWADKRIRWQNMDLAGPFVGPVSGDLDGDGIPEIVFASSESNSGNDSGRIIVLDSRTLAVRAVSAPIMDNRSSTGLHDLRLADLDGSGKLKILVAADRFYNGALEAYSFGSDNTFTRVVQVIDTGTGTGGFSSVAAADLDGDGTVELVGGAAGFVHAYDPATGKKKWRSPVPMGGSARDLVLGDLDADGVMEFTALSSGGMPYVHDGVTHAVEAIMNVTGTSMAPLATANGLHVLVGDASGKVHEWAYQAGDYAEVASWTAATVAIDGIAVASNGAIWVSEGGRMKSFTATGKLRYETIRLGGNAGRQVVRAKALGLDLTTGSRGLHGVPFAAQ